MLYQKWLSKFGSAIQANIKVITTNIINSQLGTFTILLKSTHAVAKNNKIITDAPIKYRGNTGV